MKMMEYGDGGERVGLGMVERCMVVGGGRG